MSSYNLLNGYVGSKTPYISKIKALFDPSCTSYIEPYCGGAGVYFSNYNGEYENEWINDCNYNLFTLYKALSDKETCNETKNALLKIEKPDNITEARKQFQDAKQKMLLPNIETDPYSLNRDNMVESARNTFLVYSQSFNCSAKSYSKNRSNEKYQNEVRRNLTNVLERLETGPKITCCDGLSIIKKECMKPEVQFFIDWPYVGMYRRQANLYQNEMADIYSHIEGAVALRDSKAAVVMCGYRSPRKGIPTIYDAILTGKEWHCYKLADTYIQCIPVKAGEKKASATEYVWTNRVPEYAGLYISLYDYKEKISFEEYWKQIKEAGESDLLPPNEVLEYEDAYREYCKKRLFNADCIERMMKLTRNSTMKRKLSA